MLLPLSTRLRAVPRFIFKLLLGNSSAVLGQCIAIKFHEKFYVIFFQYPLLGAPLRGFLNLRWVPINLECGKELSTMNKNNSLHDGLPALCFTTSQSMAD